MKRIILLIVTISSLFAFPEINSGQQSLNTRMCPGLHVSKKAFESSFSSVGNLIHYDIDISNNSDSIIYNIKVDDENTVASSNNLIGMLNPGATVRIRSSRTITQSDIDAGSVTGCAFVSGICPGGQTIRDSSEYSTVPGLQRPRITLTGFVSESTFGTAGEIIHYTIEAFNCGNVTLSDILITDSNALITGGNPITSLAPRQTYTITAEHIVRQQDLDSMRIHNTAWASGISPKGTRISDESNVVVLYANRQPRLAVAIFAKASSYSAIVDTLQYVIALKNYSNTTISDINISASNAQVDNEYSKNNLDPGETLLVYASHIITQVDLDTGKVTTVATVNGTSFNNGDDRSTSNEVTVFALQNPLLSLTKISERTNFSKIGDTIRYTNRIKNIGNVKISEVDLFDPGTTVLGNNHIAILYPGECADIRTVYSISQNDLNIGRVEKTSTVSGYDTNRQVIQKTSNLLIANSIQNIGLTIMVTSAETGYNNEGDKIHYFIEIRNTGNLTITNLEITNTSAEITGGNSIMAIVPGAVVVLPALHIVTRSDLAAGMILNRVGANGNTPDGQQLSVLGNELWISANTSEKLIAIILTGPSSYTKAGEEINYCITIKNNGKSPLTDISAIVANGIILSNPVTAKLAPSSSLTIQAAHLTSQADVDAGKFCNDAVVTGKYANGNPFTEKSNSLIAYSYKNPEMQISISSSQDSYESMGQQIDYSILIKNTGNVTLKNINLTSQQEIQFGGSPQIDLAPGMCTELSSRYTVAVADLDAGKIIKAITAEGKDPDSMPVVANSNETTIPGIQRPQLSIVCTSTVNDFKKKGEVIHYRIVVKNSGNVSILSTAVIDSNAVIITGRPNTILLPGETFTVGASHTVSENDISEGRIITESKAQGFDLKGDPITAPVIRKIIIGQPCQKLVVTAESPVKTFSREGDIIPLTVKVKNTGNSPMNNITISDSEHAIDFINPDASLAPGEAVTLAAEYRVTADDIKRGRIVTAPSAYGYNSNNLKTDYMGNALTFTLVIELFNLNSFPNPFSYETTITFDLNDNGVVLLKVFDMNGREVGQIDQKEFSKGRNYVTWKSNNTQKGQYLLRMIHDGNQAARVISILY